MRAYETYEDFAADHARNLNDEPEQTTFDKLMQALLAGFVTLIWLLVAGCGVDFVTEVFR